MKTIRQLLAIAVCSLMAATTANAQQGANGTVTNSTERQKAATVRSDVNEDGSVCVGDIMAIINYMAGGSNSYTTCPDNNHPHMIDLGLPSGTKWACCNVGANAPEDYGGYFAWGETKTKDVYSWDTYQYGSGYEDVVNIGSDIEGTNYDAATANWGAPWRMPMYDECIELFKNTTSVWTTQNGVYGRKFTGSNGSTIFLPAAGYRWDIGFGSVGGQGGYWSSTLYESYPFYARGLYFHSGKVYPSNDGSRLNGQSVRPVRSN